MGASDAEIAKTQSTINYKHYNKPNWEEGSRMHKVFGEDKSPKWTEVSERMGIKKVSNENDLKAMKKEVADEYMRRKMDKATKGLEKRIGALENAPKPEAAAPAPEKEEKVEDKPITSEPKPVPSAFEQKENKWTQAMNVDQWNPEGGTEAPGQADYAKAKEKAAAYKAGSSSGADIDYSFNSGGGGTSEPPATANDKFNSEITSSTDQYGNIKPSAMGAAHKAKQLSQSHLG